MGALWLTWMLAAQANGPVLLLPTRSLDAPFDAAARGDEAAQRALGPHVIPKVTAERRLGGRKLSGLAQACDYDLLCLAELGTLTGADRVLSPRLRVAPDDPEAYELEWVSIDVERATVDTVLRWRVRRASLRSAMGAAARRLSLPPDARLEIVSSESRLAVEVYGEVEDWPVGEPFPYWSGRWDVVFTSPGKQPEARTLEIGLGNDVQVIDVEMAPDLLYVPPPKAKVEVFDDPSRRTGSGVTAESITLGQAEEPKRPVLKALPWITLVLSAGAVAAGTALMVDAQNDYNQLAVEPRAVPDTTPAQQASEGRASARSQSTAGNALLWPGATGAVLSLAWGLLTL